MSRIAQAFIVGNACMDPELKHSGSGSAYVRLRVACDVYNRAAKEKQTHFITCVAFGKTAEALADWCRKGSAVSITGNLEADTSDDERYKDRLSVIVESFSVHTNRPEARGDAHEAGYDDRRDDRDRGGDRQGGRGDRPNDRGGNAGYPRGGRGGGRR